MVKHIIIWNFKEELSSAERKDYAAKIKSGLEGLAGKIDGLLDIKVVTEFLDSSNGDMMLDAAFSDEKALQAYQVNPEHLKTAQIVRSVVCSRKCVDYTV